MRSVHIICKECKKVDIISTSCSSHGGQGTIVEVEDLIFKHSQDLKLLEKYKEAAEAFRDLNTCYRLGKRPSEKLFWRLEKANQALKLDPTQGEENV